MTARESLSAEFAELLRTYLQSDDEAQLYAASELGRRLVDQAVGPEELVAVHLEAMQAALRDLPPARVPGAVLKANNLLLEAVMAYGLAYRDYVRVERQRYEEARLYAERVAAHERELQTVVEHVIDGLVLLDPEGRVRLVNPAGARALRASAPDLVGRPLDPGDLPGLDERLPEAVRQVQTEGQPVIEWEAEGEGSAWQLAVAPVRAESDALRGALVVLRDISRRRQLERLRNELVSMVSHELRTPMAAVFAYAELMVAGDVTMVEMQEYARAIHKESDRFLGLLNDFLDIRRFESGKAAYRFAPTALGPLCQDVVGLVAGAARGHTVTVDVSTDLPLVQADSGRLAQVLTNIVGNALKYSPKGGEVYVRAEVSGDEVVVAVTDEGLGVPPEAQPRLFETFYRVDSPDRRQIGGTGLGLALCRQIIEAHGGRIWAESAGAGQGSTFAFTLPVASGSPVMPDRASTLVDASMSSEPALGGCPPVAAATPSLRVLAVDDDAATRSVVARLLRPYGHTVVEAACGEEALEQLAAASFDVVFSDVHMGPGIDGWELAARVQGGWPLVRFVLVTGSGMDINMVEARARGVDAVILKPYRPEDFKRVLDRM